MEISETSKDVICPHCKYCFPDSWTFNDLDSYVCPKCSIHFAVQVEYVRMYTTIKAAAPKEAIVAASYFINGDSMEKIAKALYGDGKKYRQKAWRNINKWKEEYPKLFARIG